MNSVRRYYEFAAIAVEYNLKKLGMKTRDESGYATVEATVLIVIFVGLAALGGLLIAAKLRSNAEEIPDSVSPPT